MPGARGVDVTSRRVTARPSGRSSPSSLVPLFTFPSSPLPRFARFHLPFFPVPPSLFHTSTVSLPRAPFSPGSREELPLRGQLYR
jgi:hypothetical protein